MMPGLTLTRHRRSNDALDDGDSDPEGADASQSSADGRSQRDPPNKRQRMSDEQDPRSRRDSWHLDTPQTLSRPSRSQARRTRPQRATGPSSGTADSHATPQHQPGAIVRVTLTDFVTYSSASFHLGPALNMVIGPNGTGKSTLVCAICIGLGWPTNLLGRAKDVHEFVKHDRDEAAIEIELKGKPGRTNPVIKRQIKKDNTSKWWLNGQQTNQKSVVSLAKSFNIQIDNLCQFLPQDRVVEFAALSPVDRLTQTIRATAPDYMVERHNDLKALRGEQKSLEKDQASAKDHLANLESRQILQQADVERLRERERLLDEADFLEKLRPWAEYNTAKIKSKDAKEKETAAKQDLRRLKAEVAPSLRAVNAKEAYADKVKDVVERRRNLLTGIERQAEDCFKKKETLSDKIEGCVQKREAERSSNKAEKSKIIDLQRNIQGVKSAMENAPPSFDAAEFNERKRDKTRQVRDVQARMQELENQSGALTVELNQKKQLMATAETEAADLRSRLGQQMSILKREYPDTYKAWEWIRQNQDKFESQVYGPAIVECSVNEKRFVKAIESLFQKTEFCAITCTNDNDLKVLSRQLFDIMKLPDISLRNHKSPLANYRPPVNDEEKQRLGITGWALEYMTGPEPVLSMLCSERSRLHSTAIIEKDRGDEQYALLEQSVIENWVTMTTSYRVIRRREYNASTTVVNQIRDAKVWTEQQVDTRQEGDLRDNIDQWTSELSDLQEKISSNKQEHNRLRNQEQGLKAEEAAVEKEKAELQRKTSDFNALPNKLRNLESRLASMQKAEKELRQRLEQLVAEESKYALEKGQAAINYSRTVDTFRTMHAQLVEAAVAYVEASSDVETLRSRNHAVKTMLETREKEVQEVTKQCQALHAESKRLFQTCSTLWNADPDLVERMRHLPEEEQNRTVEEINLAIEDCNARLGLIHGGSAGIIKEFEDRARKIEKLRSTLSSLEGRLACLSTNIEDIRATWEPELDALVAQISEAFSASFEKIRCAGEVVVDKDGKGGRDFESWAMHIKVKFREEEELSNLDSHRQSGGERAVSTIFYLMALQSLSRAPFRVVDEINQGMDPRNERIVHERLVDIACGMQNPDDDGGTNADVTSRSNNPTGSQYFLITPKLLTNLKYSPGMKIHCIASGPYMPTDPAQLDFKTLVSRARQLMESRPQGAAAGLVESASPLSVVT